MLSYQTGSISIFRILQSCISFLNLGLENSEIVLDMIDKSIKLSWWTNDVTWWNRIAEYFWDNQLQDDNYVDSIKEWKNSPFVIQVADSDVTENWVDSLRSKFTDTLWKEISKSIPIKRLILWEKSEEEINPKDYVDGFNWRWNWDIKTVDWKLIRQSVSVYSNKEIERQLKNIFDGFLLEVFKVTKK